MLQFKHLTSQHLSHFNNNVKDCITQLINFTQKGNTILFQTIFIAVASETDYLQKKDTLTKYLKKWDLECIPTSTIAQKPHEHSILFEIAYSSNAHIQIEDKQINGLPYRLIKTPFYSQIIAFGLSDYVEQSLHKKSIAAFEKAKAILNSEDIDFSDIVRQWNYIENITCEQNSENEVLQHYQIFNDVRSQYYGECCFNEGYPAATGIGIQTGGVIIDFIAIKPHQNTQVIPMVNPNQIDAHRYSNKVLVGSTLAATKTTPKFERAKAVITNNIIIFVSGTAAIQGELSVKTCSAKEQTLKTLLNIEKLIANENLNEHNITIKNTLKCLQLRVYVREGEKSNDIKHVLKSKYPNTPCILLTGNICRNDLLVEIEGIFGN